MSNPAIYPYLEFAAWVMTTCGPPAVAVVFWKIAKRVQRSWLIHLIFIPALLTIEWGAIWLLFFAAGDTGDGPPGLGLAILPGLFLVALSVVAYAITLAATQISRVRRRT
jgi:hypothetical protein